MGEMWKLHIFRPSVPEMPEPDPFGASGRGLSKKKPVSEQAELHVVI
ncbi:MAG: hypothetical protein R3C97_13320 [Geminicoccaceae bacterium]